MGAMTAQAPAGLVSAASVGGRARRLKPVQAWAVVGAAVWALQLTVWAAWIVSGDAVATPTGPTPVPTYMEVAVVVAQWGGLLATAVFLWFFLVRPWRREGRIGLDGLFCLVFLTICWQDTLINGVQHQVMFNSTFFNRGSWNAHFPGWLAPHGNLNPVPLLFYPFYIWGIFGGVVAGGAVMRKVKERRPTISRAGLVAGCFGFFLLFEIVVEPPLMLLGLWAYPGTIDWLTVFAGHYYQFPLTELLLMATLWTVWTCLRFFRDDQGHTVAERGINDVRADGWRRTGLRYLALVGACNAIIVVLYQLPSALIGLYISDWPKDIVERSYFTNGVCGPGSDYACPGPRVPIPRPDSDHLNPAGHLVPAKGATP
jgi:hypothetical protein